MQRKREPAKAYLAGLDRILGAELMKVLQAASCELTDDPKRAQIVFCGWESPACRDAAGRFGNVPVVVVSRLPEVNVWLDALEAGAADYCASPFEAIHLRWLLETHVWRRPQPPKTRRAAA